MLNSSRPLLNDFLVQLDQRRHLAEHSFKALLPRLQLIELNACPQRGMNRTSYPTQIRHLQDQASLSILDRR